MQKHKEKLSHICCENCQKVAKYPDLTFFLPFGPEKNYIESDSIKSILWQTISTLLGKLFAKLDKKVSNSDWENCLQVENEPNVTNQTSKHEDD